jgi:ribose 5-phosphate isomerase B
MRIALSSDEATELTVAAVAHLTGLGHEVLHPVPVGSPWPDVGRAVGEAVTSGGADLGIVCCWTGTGVAMAANKVGGVRAALCSDAETARGARRWNDANVLALSLRSTTPTVASEIIDAFLAAEPDESERANWSRLG